MSEKGLIPMKSQLPFSQIALIQDLKDWWESETDDWDKIITGQDSRKKTEDDDLWDDLPEVDSKTIARSSPIFERHLGISLNVNLIKPGGYETFNEVIDHLVPEMIKLRNGEIKKPRRRKAEKVI